MKIMREVFLLLLLLLFVLMAIILGAIIHERDIYNSCVKYGTSGRIGITIDISCSEMKKGD